MIYGAALVTGGAKRLGRSIVFHLANRGTDVVVHYATSRAEAEQVVANLCSTGVRAVALKADLLDERSCVDLVGRASEALGKPLDVLINNASIFEHDVISTATRTGWDRHMMSNFRAPFVLTQEFAKQAPPPIKDANDETLSVASVINMVDQRVRRPTPEFVTYTLAKLGLWNLTVIAAKALAPGIRVNAIGPGPTLQGHRQSEDHFKRQRQAVVLERGANPRDISAAVDFLLDSPAVTGQLICIDGGQHLAWKTPDIVFAR